MVKEYDEVSITWACRLVEVHRSFYYYVSLRDDSQVETAIRAASEFEDGFWKIYARLRHEGYPWNHKRVYRVYTKLRYNKRRKFA